MPSFVLLNQNTTFRTLNVYKNHFISKIVMECFHVHLCNTPIFAQSSLEQGTL